MKLLDLSLLKFGPFTDVALDFSRRPRALHLVVGSNAAGKSTTLRAVLDLLFGIPETTRDNHLHGNPDLRIGGRIEDEDGHEIAVIRRKGRVNTLADRDGRAVDEGRLRAELSGLGREQFEVMFGLSHASLLRGGRALLEGKGDLGESLFNAGLGASGVHQILRELEGKAEELFKPNGKNQRINRAIAAFKEAKKSAQDQSLQTKEWEDLQEDLRRQEARVAEIEAALSELRVKQSRLNRIRQALGPVALRADLVAKLDAHRDVVLLAETAAEERRAAERTIADARPAEARLKAEIDALVEKLAALRVPDELLARDAAVRQIQLDLGSHLKSESDLPRRRAELRALEEEAKGILGRLGQDAPLDEIHTLRLPPTLETRLRALAVQRAKLDSESTTVEQTRRDKAEKLAAEQKALTSLTEPPDAEPLRRALDLARRDGELEKRLREQDTIADAQRDAVMRGLASLGSWSGPLNAIGSLPVPTVETVDHFERSLGVLTTETSAASQRAADRRAQLEQIEEQIEELKLGAPVPTEADLAASRSDRDRAWAWIRHVWLGDTALEGDDKPENAATLATAHEHRTRAADDIADRLRREADRVAKFASLMARRIVGQQELEEITRHISGLASQHAAELERWCARWKASGVEPLTPAEMRSWLVRYSKLVDDRGRWTEAIRARDAIAASIAAHREALSRCLTALDVPIVDGAEGLAVLVARAGEVIEQLAARSQRRSRLVEQQAELEAEVRRLDGVASQHARSLEQWQRQWSEVTSALHLDLSALPEEAEVIVGLRRDLLVKSDLIASMRRRIDAMEADSVRFTSRVRELAQSAAPDLVSETVERAAEAMVERFQAGDKDRAIREQLTRRVQDKRDELAGVVEKRGSAEEQVGRLLAAACCASVPELIVAEDRSHTVRDLRRELEIVETRLRDLAEGAGAEALVDACKGCEVDAVAAELAAVETEIRRAEQDRKAPEQAIGELRARRQAMNGGDLAAAAAARAQQELALLRSHVEDYVRVRLAAILLEEEIKRYRERNQGPIVRRASALFHDLTLGTFAGLEVGYDDKEVATIRCVRADDKMVDVEGLSDGTRDQLYLALRLASLERHLERNKPVPVVMDDLLVNFDDRRAAAALSALSTLASRTQVLFFTHHRHLLDLAQGAVAKELLVAHDLDALTGGDLVHAGTKGGASAAGSTLTREETA